MSNSKSWLFGLTIIACLAIVQENKESKEKRESQQKHDSLVIKDPTPHIQKRGYDYINNRYLEYKVDDDMIRHLRENNPDKIIRVPGRYVPTSKELFEEKLEDYIDEHHDELLERYKED